MSLPPRPSINDCTLVIYFETFKKDISTVADIRNRLEPLHPGPSVGNLVREFIPFVKVNDSFTKENIH